MTTSDRAIDRNMKYIMIFIIAAAILCAEMLRAENPKQSRFSANTLRIGIESFLQDRLEDSDEFEIAKEIQDQVFAEGFVVARCDAATESLAGSTRIQLIFSKNDNVLRRVYVPVRITLKRAVPIALRSMQKGEVVQPSDVELKVADITYLNTKVADDFVGKKLTNGVSKGAVLTQSQLTNQSSIQRGDVVSIIIQSGAVAIRATGSALDDATNGQTLRVRREDSASIISGVASDNKSVIINIPQIPPSSSQK